MIQVEQLRKRKQLRKQYDESKDKLQYLADQSYQIFYSIIDMGGFFFTEDRLVFIKIYKNQTCGNIQRTALAIAKQLPIDTQLPLQRIPEHVPQYEFSQISNISLVKNEIEITFKIDAKPLSLTIPYPSVRGLWMDMFRAIKKEKVDILSIPKFKNLKQAWNREMWQRENQQRESVPRMSVLKDAITIIQRQIGPNPQALARTIVRGRRQNKAMTSRLEALQAQNTAITMRYQERQEQSRIRRNLQESRREQQRVRRQEQARQREQLQHHQIQMDLILSILQRAQTKPPLQIQIQSDQKN